MAIRRASWGTALPLLLLQVLLLGACDGNEPRAGSDNRGATQAPSPVESAEACPNAERVLKDPAARRPGSLTADFDGDGREDEAFLLIDEAGPPGCAAWLVMTVEPAAGSLAVPVADDLLDVAAGFPRLKSAVDIDSTPGTEVLIDIHAGASTQFLAAFRFGRGGPERIQLEGVDFPNVFAYGGSVGHVDAVDCAGSEEVVVSSAVARGRLYEVRRLFLRPRDSSLVVDPDRTQMRRLPAERLERLDEFVASPFGSCPA